MEFALKPPKVSSAPETAKNTVVPRGTSVRKLLMEDVRAKNVFPSVVAVHAARKTLKRSVLANKETTLGCVRALKHATPDWVGWDAPLLNHQSKSVTASTTTATAWPTIIRGCHQRNAITKPQELRADVRARGLAEVRTDGCALAQLQRLKSATTKTTTVTAR